MKILATKCSNNLFFLLGFERRTFHTLHRVAPKTLLTYPKRFFMQPPDFDPNVDYYKALGVPSTATEKDIKVQFYKLA